MNGPFHAVYVCDRAYRPYVEVSAASVKWSAEGDVTVHVINADDSKIAARLAEFPWQNGSDPLCQLSFPRKLAKQV